MSGREGSVFSFDVDEWTAELIERFKSQLQSHAERLSLQIEQLLQSQHAKTLDELDAPERRIFKNNLRADVEEVSKTLRVFLNDALDTHSNILTTYLKEHVFFVPPTAILAVSPLDVPLPAKKDAQSSIESQREVSRNNEGQAELEGGKSDNKSLEEVLTSIHKTEYFLARLKQVHEENDRYLQLLQSILRSMLELDEKTKENDTSAAVKHIMATIQSSMSALSGIQAELNKRGIAHDLAIPSSSQKAK